MPVEDKYVMLLMFTPPLYTVPCVGSVRGVVVFSRGAEPTRLAGVKLDMVSTRCEQRTQRQTRARARSDEGDASLDWK